MAPLPLRYAGVSTQPARRENDMSKDARETATDLLVAALASGKVSLSGNGAEFGKTIGDAFTAILQAVKESEKR